MIIKKIFIFLIYVFLFSCSDTQKSYDENYDNYKSSRSVISGETCAQNCIWSSWAVTHGAQQPQKECETGYCACVVIGDIWQQCSIEDININKDTSVAKESLYDEYKGALLADKAYLIASNRNTVGACYAAVADAIDVIIAVFLYGRHAYEAANQLANSQWFYEIHEYNLNNLPLGAVVVWAKGNSRSGHISISIGNGMEASDHIARQMINHYGGGKERVFLPKK